MFRLVIDTNILVAAFLTPHGQSAELLRRALEQHTTYLSSFILDEFLRVLNYAHIRRRYQFSDEDIEQFVTQLTHCVTLIVPQTDIDVCQDPDDNAVLACAVEAEAHYLITRNIKDFPERYEGVEVVGPNKFLALT